MHPKNILGNYYKWPESLCKRVRHVVDLLLDVLEAGEKYRVDSAGASHGNTQA